jgi:hypothetical protein
MTRAGFLLTLLTGFGGQAPKADPLLQKALDRYDYLKSVQVTVSVFLPVAKSAVTGEAEAIVLKAQYLNDGKGNIAKSRIEYTAPVGTTPESETGQGSWIVVDDGKALYTLYPNLKAYTKATRRKDRFSALFRPTIDRMRTRGVKFIVTEAKLDGEPVYSVQGRSIDGFAVNVVINKATLGLKRLIVASATGRVVNQILVTEQTNNPTLDPMLFQLPADYKLLSQ